MRPVLKTPSFSRLTPRCVQKEPDKDNCSLAKVGGRLQAELEKHGEGPCEASRVPSRSCLGFIKAAAGVTPDGGGRS
jgi:hypothetical protein